MNMSSSKAIYGTLKFFTLSYQILLMFAVQVNSDTVPFTNSTANLTSSAPTSLTTSATKSSLQTPQKQTIMPVSIPSNQFVPLSGVTNGTDQPTQHMNQSIFSQTITLPQCVPLTQIPFPSPPVASKSGMIFVSAEDLPPSPLPSLLQPLALFNNPSPAGSVVPGVPVSQAIPVSAPASIAVSEAPGIGQVVSSTPVISARINFENSSSTTEREVHISNPYIWQYPGNGPKRTREGNACRTIWESSYTSWLDLRSPTTSSGPADVTHSNVPRNPSTYANFTRTYRSLPYVDPQNSNTFTFTPSGSCCLECWVRGGDVQVYHWPTPAPVPPVTQLINEMGYTFVSPSVYVRFASLHADDFCGDMYIQGTAVTIPFAPDELSTTAGYKWNTDSSIAPILVDGLPRFTQATWGDQTSCSNKTESFWQIHYSSKRYSDVAQLTSAWSSYYSSLGCGVVDIKDHQYDHYTVTYNQCSPTLAVPSKILSLNSLWSDCGPGISGFYDPPTTLTPGNGFSTTSNINHAPVFSKGPQPGPAPGSTPPPAIASSTTEAEHKPTATNVASPVPAPVNHDPAPSPNRGSSPDGESSLNGSPVPSGGSSAIGAPGSSPQNPATPNEPNLPNGPDSPHPPNDPNQSSAKDPVAVNPINGLPPPSKPRPGDNPQVSVPINPINGLPFPSNPRPGDNPQMTASMNPINGLPLPSNPPPGNTPPSPVNAMQAPNEEHAIVTNSPSLDTIPKYILGDKAQTLATGSVATISGTTISLQLGGLSVVVDDGKTIALDSFLSAAGLRSGASIVVGGKTEKLGGTPGISSETDSRTSSYRQNAGIGVYNGTILIESGSGVLMDGGVWILGVIMAGVATVVVLF